MLSTTWAATMKATALTTAARKTATVVRSTVDAPWGWNPREVWLSRVRQPRDRAARSYPGNPATPRGPR